MRDERDGDGVGWTKEGGNGGIEEREERNRHGRWKCSERWTRWNGQMRYVRSRRGNSGSRWACRYVRRLESERCTAIDMQQEK